MPSLPPAAADAAEQEENVPLAAPTADRDVAAAGDLEADRPAEEHPAAGVASERLLVAQLRERPSIEACRSYLAEHPAGQHREEVEELLAELTWRQVASAPTIPRIRSWLAEHGDSPFAEEARRLWERTRLAEVREAETVELCDLYLEELPTAPHAGEVREIRRRAAAWAAAERNDTVDGYLAFLEAHPTSVRRQAASERTGVAHWRRRAASVEDPHAAEQLARACLVHRACSLDEIAATARRALELDPRRTAAALILARILYSRDELEATARLLAQALRVDADIGEAYFLLGKIATRRGDCRGALRQFDRALELAPGHVGAHFHRGACRAELGSCNDGLSDFRAVVAGAGEEDAKFAIVARQKLRICSERGRGGGE